MRGLGITASLMVSPDQSISELPYFFTAGILARGVFAQRPTDVAAFDQLAETIDASIQGDAEVLLDGLEQVIQRRSLAELGKSLRSTGSPVRAIKVIDGPLIEVIDGKRAA